MDSVVRLILLYSGIVSFYGALEIDQAERQRRMEAGQLGN